MKNSNFISGILLFVFISGIFLVIYINTGNSQNFVEVQENIDTSNFIQYIEKNFNK